MSLNRSRDTIRQRRPGSLVTLNSQRVARRVIVIGASAGGVEALMHLFSMFPPDIPAIIGCVLHRGTLPGQLSAVLGRRSRLPVIEPRPGEVAKQGAIYLAPADYHLMFEKDKLKLERGPRENSTRPAIDPLFRSAAETYGEAVVGVLLTGGGEDGASGLTAIGNANGLALVQDPNEAYMPYMPLNAIRFDHVDGAFPLDALAPILASLARGEKTRDRGALNHTPREQPATYGLTVGSLDGNRRLAIGEHGSRKK
jgi:two-component system, chemotaxis family, protein-glutamate methylesterase/glutaminase